MTDVSSTKLEMLKAKIKRMVEEKDKPKIDFLKIIACHNGYLTHDSVTISFKIYKEKYGYQKFESVKKYLLDEGIIFVPEEYNQPICFSIKNEKGEYNRQLGEGLSRFFGELIFKHEGKIKETIDAVLEEPEGKEFLKFVAKEKGIHIYDGREPEIKEIIGRQSYERILSKFLELGILNEYTWSSRKHTYAGYKLLPYIDNYIKSRIFELDETEKMVLTYIASLHKIFESPTNWFILFRPSLDFLEYGRELLAKCELAQKFLAFVIDRTVEDIERIIEKLQNKGLIQQVDLGYSRAGIHSGIVLQLSQSGREIVERERNKLIRKVEDRIREIFSERDNQIIYYLFSQERIPLRILSLIKRSSVDALKRTGLIGEDLFLQFKKDSPISQYIVAGIEPETIRKWLKEECESILSKEEKLFLGFLSNCKNIILDKRPDWRVWNQVTSKTQRKYQAAFTDVIPNFGHLKKLFSYITNLSIDKTEKIATNLEKNGFLVRERSYCGFPGYATTYRIPVKLNFEFDFSPLNSKITSYIDFLFGNFEQNHNQIIFLDYLTEFYDQENFMVKASKVKNLLEFLNYDPPKQYLPIYFLENGNVFLHPSVLRHLKQEILKLKFKEIEPIKTLILDACQKYRNNVLYNYRETPTKDYYILHIESPDPSTGIVSFVAAPWVYVTDLKKIHKFCEKSNTVNLFVIYPNYPQLRKVLAEAKNYNLFITRKGEVYTSIKRLDPLTESFMTQLSKRIKMTEIERLAPTEGQEIGIGVLDEIPIVAGQINKAENAIEKWFKKLKGNVIAMLDFIDKTTFGYLDSIPKECGIRIITSKIKEKDKCRVKAEKTARDRPFFEIMEVSKIHGERWIGSEDSFIIQINVDLKTEALGHKTHTIRVIKPEAYRKAIKTFYELWNKSQKELQRLYGSKLVKSLFFSKK